MYILNTKKTKASIFSGNKYKNNFNYKEHNFKFMFKK